MKKRAFLKIIGTQELQNDVDNKTLDDDKIELMTTGNFYKKNENYFISYKESLDDNQSYVKTIIKVEPHGKITVSRNGNNSSEMVFEKGQQHLSQYDVGEGPFVVCICANSINNSLSDNGGNLSIDYNITINDYYETKNKFNIFVKEAKEQDVSKSNKLCN